jgi:hypothetical protein
MPPSFQHTRDVAETIHHWLLTPNGKEFVKSMPAMSRPEDMSRSSFHRSFSSFSGSRIPSQQGRVESNDAFSSVQRIMQTNVDWLKIETIPEPICIVTSASPHLILKSSDALSELLNLTSSDLFGQSLQSLLSPTTSLPLPRTATSTSTGFTSVSMNQGTCLLSSEAIQQNRMALEDFYSKLESKSTTSESRHCHCVLTFPSLSLPETVGSPPLSMSCLVYAYPVYYQEILYREYYPGLVNIFPDSIGTTFSSEDPSHFPPFSSFPRSLTAPLAAPPVPSLDIGPSGPGSGPGSLSNFRKKYVPPAPPPSSFSPPNGILYYQLHFNKIEYALPSSAESSGHDQTQPSSTLIGNFVRMFSTSSARSSSGFHRTETTNTASSNGQRLLSTGSGRSSSLRDSKRTHRTSGSSLGVVRSSAGEREEVKLEEEQEHEQQSVVPVANEDETPPPPASEKSFGEFDSLESGLMLERTNTNSSFRSLNTDSGWAHKY